MGEAGGGENPGTAQSAMPARAEEPSHQSARVSRRIDSFDKRLMFAASEKAGACAAVCLDAFKLPRVDEALQPRAEPAPFRRSGEKDARTHDQSLADQRAPDSGRRDRLDLAVFDETMERLADLVAQTSVGDAVADFVGGEAGRPGFAEEPEHGGPGPVRR